MKVLTIIQARLNSTRFPRKVLKKIEGESILSHIIEFSNMSKMTDQIVIATTDLPEDVEIEKLSTKMGIECFRGPSDDVLKRFYDAAKYFDAELIIRLTGDNPLVNPILIDDVIKVCKEHNCDYASNILTQTFPVGYSPCEAVSFPTLEQLYYNEKDPMTREHVTYKIRKNPDQFKIREVRTPPKLARPQWRLTIDYEEDFILMKKIFEKLYSCGDFIHYDALVKFLDDNQNLLKINEKYRKTI